MFLLFFYCLNFIFMKQIKTKLLDVSKVFFPLSKLKLTILRNLILWSRRHNFLTLEILYISIWIRCYFQVGAGIRVEGDTYWILQTCSEIYYSTGRLNLYHIFVWAGIRFWYAAVIHCIDISTAFTCHSGHITKWSNSSPSPFHNLCVKNSLSQFSWVVFLLSLHGMLKCWLKCRTKTWDWSVLQVRQAITLRHQCSCPVLSNADLYFVIISI